MESYMHLWEIFEYPEDWDQSKAVSTGVKTKGTTESAAIKNFKDQYPSKVKHGKHYLGKEVKIKKGTRAHNGRRTALPSSTCPQLF